VIDRRYVHLAVVHLLEFVCRGVLEIQVDWNENSRLTVRSADRCVARRPRAITVLNTEGNGMTIQGRDRD